MESRGGPRGWPRGRWGHTRPRGQRGQRGQRSRPYPSYATSSMGESSLTFTNVLLKSQFHSANQSIQRNTVASGKRDPIEITFGLEELLELSSGDPMDILMCFSRQNKKFTNTLVRSADSMKADTIVLLMRCLSKLCDVAFDETKSSILEKISQSHFVMALERYFLALPYVKINDKQWNNLFWSDCDSFWNDIFKFYNYIIALMPSVALETLPKLVDTNKLAIQGLADNHMQRLNEELLEMFDNVQTRLVVLKEEAAAKLESRKAAHEELQVPDDFRCKPILPDVTEITTRRSVFVRPNIVEGAYNSVEHYLDVQFRLMREDYISPMRDAIMSFIKDPTQRKYSGGRFYRTTTFKHLAVSNKRVGILVSFNQQKRSWSPKAFMKRFFFGSLLCFTKDNFVTCFYGTVIDRSEELLSRGAIIVDMENVELNDNFFFGTYTMFESDVFYSQYGPVLKALQSIGDNLPMKDCIVNMQVSDKLPLYVNSQKPYVISADLFINNITEEGDWPTANELGLDESQYAAYKMALTREFVTIQGPPGTGKTYIGLKIVETLLRNLTAAEKPILVLCYTNHALDQFLAGILPATEKIVRIGGQSKNEEFAEKYNLSSLRNRHNDNSYLACLRSVINKMTLAQNAIFDIDSTYCILDDTLLLQDLERHNLLSYLTHFESSTHGLKRWLLMEDRPSDIWRYASSGENLIRCYKDILSSVSQSYKDDMDDLKNLLADDYEKKDLKRDRITLFSLAKKIEGMNLIITKLEQCSNRDKLENRRIYLLCELFFFQQQLSSDRKMAVDFSKQPPTELNSNQRWNLYWFWCERLKPNLFDSLMSLQDTYHKIFKLYEDENMINDIKVLEDADVIGLTTTAASRLRPLLCTLSPSIVVVEEAAEVLESHVIVNLNEHCKHVIMIGDHQQLRPMTASYRLGKQFNLEISLFERIFKNGKNFCQLGVQHRMRPEIANLISPSLYLELGNHPSVYDYPDVKGVSKNLYFITHNVCEEVDDDLSSRTNSYEAEFVIRMAKYLIQQGYQPGDITMLSTYSGQMFYLRQLKKSIDILKGVRLCVLDNYQGEENKIILLTLVRSNSENQIGFLNISNRVCVALSRAREGFYIIGNMTNLTHSSELWNNINTTLLNQNSIGLSIPLQCQNHNIVTQITTHTDFDKVSGGGCQIQCKVLLKCGHICQRLCHIDLTKHNDYKCEVKCEKECDLGHRCRLMCFQTCVCSEMVQKLLNCGHIKSVPCHISLDKVKCFEEVTFTLPLCSHKTKTCCYMAKEDIPCPIQCIDRLPCGHACTKLCHKKNDPEHLEYECKIDCGRQNKKCTEDHRCLKLCFEECDDCTIKIIKKRKNCAHNEKVSCCQDIDEIPCNKACKRTMPCGHFCVRKCSEPCTGCLVMVKKQRSCGHVIFIECSQDPDLIDCSQRCNLLLKCGHRCLDKCSGKCGQTPCIEKVPNPYESQCGHDYKIFCKDTGLGSLGSILTMEHCMEPCGMILKDCEHICQGLCGKCRGRLHPPCSQPCGNLLICGHICEDPCREFCSMCRKPCIAACAHSKCSLLCGVPCIPCKHTCSLGCVHSKCTKECGEVCNQTPCSEPCTITQKCGHSCFGLCSEQCPDICKICKVDEFPKILFGDEDDDGARFIKLMDCGHVIEVNAMDQWVNAKESGEIAYPRCPLCSTFVMSTPRYCNATKTAFQNVQNAKKKMYGNPIEIKTLVAKLEVEVKKLSNARIDALFAKVDEWKLVVGKIKNDLMIKNYQKDIQDKKKWARKTVQLSKVDIENFMLQSAILNRLAEIFIERNQQIQSQHIQYQVKFMLRVLYECKRKVTQQQVDDFESELHRTNSMVRYDIAEDLMISIVDVGTNTDKNKLSHLSKLIFSNKYFDTATKTEVDGLFDSLSFKVDNINLKRSMIVKAIGLKQGTWFACPNGHPYCIGECGGAMEEGKCPDCGCTIGGSSHSLLSDNRLAPEMDNATHAAYSDIANEQAMINCIYFEIT